MIYYILSALSAIVSLGSLIWFDKTSLNQENFSQTNPMDNMSSRIIFTSIFWVGGMIAAAMLLTIGLSQSYRIILHNSAIFTVVLSSGIFTIGLVSFFITIKIWVTNLVNRIEAEGVHNILTKIEERNPLMGVILVSDFFVSAMTLFIVGALFLGSTSLLATSPSIIINLICFAGTFVLMAFIPKCITKYARFAVLKAEKHMSGDDRN
jgi:hypothetical protein